MLLKVLPMTLSRRIFFATVLVSGLTSCAPVETPEVLVQAVARLPTQLDESSALAIHEDIVWTLNDSGSGAILHALSMEGELLSSVTVLDAENTDWESLAQDEQYLYIADTGNNFNNRDSFRIYRIAIPAIGQQTVNAETISISYEDYEAGSPMSHNFDSEALAVRHSELWLFTKNRGDRNTNLYRFPKTPGTYRVGPSQSLAVNALVTAADINEETGELVLLTYGQGDSGAVAKLWWASTSEAGVDWDNHHSLSIGPFDQWEAVSWRSEEELMLTHENSRQGFAGLARLQRAN